MTTSGLNVIPGNDMTRIKVACEHQSGLIYVVPADRSWVCDQVNMPAHALAGTELAREPGCAGVDATMGYLLPSAS